MSIEWIVGTIILAAIAITAGLGGNFMSSSPPDFAASKMVFTCAFGFLLLAVALSFFVFSDEQRIRLWKLLIVAYSIGFEVVGAGWIGTLSWVQDREARAHANDEAIDAKQKNRLSSPATPAIMVRYNYTVFLPISIPSHSNALILQLHPGIVEGFFVAGNGGDKPIEWPPQLKHAEPESAERKQSKHISEYTIFNYGDKPVMNVSLVFDIQFLEAKRRGLTKRYEKPDGKNAIEIPGPPPGGMATTEHISGDIISSHKHTLVIPAIEPKVPISFYIVNQSGSFGKVFFLKMPNCV